jgi:hypothetical protein
MVGSIMMPSSFLLSACLLLGGCPVSGPGLATKPDAAGRTQEDARSTTCTSPPCPGFGGGGHYGPPPRDDGSSSGNTSEMDAASVRPTFDALPPEAGTNNRDAVPGDLGTSSETGTLNADASSFGTRVPPPLPTARAALAVVAGLDGRLFALGGYDRNQSAVASNEVYDPRTNRWTLAAPMPTARFALAAAVSATGKIFVVGGSARSGDGSAVSIVEIYDPILDKWEAGVPLPSPRNSLAATFGEDGRLYAVGGYRKGGLVESIGSPTGTWDPALSLAMDHGWYSAAVRATGRIFVIGGASAQGLGQAFNESLDSGSAWVAHAPMMQGRSDLAAATGPDGDIYVVGGLTTNVGPALLLSSAEAYSVRDDRWRALPPLRTPRAQLGAAFAGDGRLYAVGGSDDNFAALNRVEALGPGGWE